MTKSGFKYAMQRGLGSCMLVLESASDIEQYRDIILWGCLRELALDPQCEGTGRTISMSLPPTMTMRHILSSRLLPP